MKRIVLILIIGFSFMSSLKAECPYSDVVKYNELANYIESNYKYNRETNKFDLVFYNVDNNLEIGEKNNTYKPNNNEVVILEKMNMFGRKLLITGKGRCNITSSLDISEFIQNIPGNGRFLYSCFEKFTNKDM